MQTLSLNLQIVTPMFLGGSDPISVELRAPSIKGMLRFWHRAIDPHYRTNELLIFGGTGDTGEDTVTGSKAKNKIGASVFCVRVEPVNLVRESMFSDCCSGLPLKYLGYGLEAGKKKKKCIPPRETKPDETTVLSEFKLKLSFRPRATSEHILAVKKALWAWLVFGGLGARNRRGFGSLLCTSLTKGSLLPEHPLHFDSATEFTNAAQRFLAGVPLQSEAVDLPEHTSWSRWSRCVIGPEQANSKDALIWIGERLIQFRTNPDVPGRETKKFWPDHELMYNYVQVGTRPLALPERVVFGLPHNYYFSDRKKAEVNQIEIETDGTGNEKIRKGRRASPLFIHIQKLSTGMACAVATFLPATFVAPQCIISISRNRDERCDFVIDKNWDGIYSPIEDFLNDLISNHGAIEA